MKKVAGIFLVLVSLVFSLSSCLKDDGSSSPEYVSYGMVQGDYPNSRILTDEGTILEPSAETMPTGMRDGMRVLVNYYRVTTYSGGSYGIDLIDIRELLLDVPVDLTNPNNPDIYGDEPLGNFQWGLSSRYLNVMVTYSYAIVNNHTFDLVLTGYNAQTNTLNYEFRHTSQDLATMYTGNEIISFDLQGVIPSGQTSVNFTIRWMGSGDQTTTVSGVYSYIAED